MLNGLSIQLITWMVCPTIEIFIIVHYRKIFKLDGLQFFDENKRIGGEKNGAI